MSPANFFSSKAKSFPARLVLALLLILQCQSLFAIPSGEVTDSIQRQDSINNPARWLAGKSAANLLKKRTADYYEHQAILKQGRNFILLKSEIETAWNFIGQGFDYDEVREEIKMMYTWRGMAVKDVIVHPDSILTARNLTTTAILVNELLNRTRNRVTQILAYHKSLGQIQSRLDSLAMNSILYKVPADPEALKDYTGKTNALDNKLEPVNHGLRLALDSIQRLETRIYTLKAILESDISDIESLRRKTYEEFEFKLSGRFKQPASKNNSAGQIIGYSWDKAALVLVFYIFNHYDKLVLMLLFIVGGYFYLIMLRKKCRVDGSLEQLNTRQHVLKYPFASATFMVIAIFQFFLPLPPIIFSGLIWILSAVLLSVIIRQSVSGFWFNIWLLFTLQFLLAFFDNLILKQSLFEQWGILLLSISGLATGVFILVKNRKNNKQDKVIMLAIGVMSLYELLSIYFNLTGGYDFAKSLMSNGLYTIVVAFLLLWTLRLWNETLRISYHYFHGSEEEKRPLTDLNFNNTFPGYFYLLFFAGWVVLIARTTYFYQSLFEPLKETLIVERHIGDFSFTYQSIVVFFFVLFLAGFIARIVSFISADPPESAGKSRNSGLGSWLLLVRIAIIAAGVTLAFISAGIPMDRFAIILGALSVGIGFGLQTLVNNLVSGLIIAFEKPVNVGDIVDFAGQTGKMKSIGIRSSVVTTWDGADVIIPNGDLLNQHLVNWTLGSSRRRFVLKLGVAYGTDLANTRQLLLDMMQKDSRILKNPEPVVLANEFSDSSVDFTLKFWVAHFSIGFDVKSDLILAIDVLFKEEGIVIPFPQRDVHIRSAIDPDEKKA